MVAALHDVPAVAMPIDEGARANLGESVDAVLVRPSYPLDKPVTQALQRHFKRVLTLAIATRSTCAEERASHER